MSAITISKTIFTILTALAFPFAPGVGMQQITKFILYLVRKNTYFCDLKYSFYGGQ